MSYQRFDPPPQYRVPPPPLMAPPRQRSSAAGKFMALLIVVALLFAGWTILWFFARGQAEATINGWRAREAQASRIHTCATQSIGGFPFRIELYCDLAGAELRNFNPPLEVKTTSVLVAAQIYQPTLLISEFTGPLSIGEAGRAPSLVANWRLAQTSVRGLPADPERVSIVIDDPTLGRLNSAGAPEPLANAKRAELHGRIAEGSVRDNPVIELSVKMDDASLPVWHAAAVAPIDSEITGTLRGLKDFAPKPWSQRFREIQAAGGRIDIDNARVAQGETIAVGGGTLQLTADGRLDGQLRLTVVGLEQFLTAIGIERNPQVDRLANSLDKLLPGLGQVAREKAGATIAGGVGFLGEQTTLEGKRAVTVSMRFENGAIFIGPLRVGQSPSLF